MVNLSGEDRNFDIQYFCSLLKENNDEEALIYFSDNHGETRMLSLVFRRRGLGCYDKSYIEDVMSEIKVSVLITGLQKLDRNKSVNEMSDYLLRSALYALVSVIANNMYKYLRVPAGIVFNAEKKKNIGMLSLDYVYNDGQILSDIIEDSLSLGDMKNKIVVDGIWGKINKLKYRNIRDKKIVFLYIQSILEGGGMTLSTIGKTFDLTAEGTRIIVNKYLDKVKNDFGLKEYNII